MTTMTGMFSGAPARPVFGLGPRLVSVLKCRWHAYRIRKGQRLAAAQLRSLSHAQLKDMGISRAQIELAVQGVDVRGQRVAGARPPVLTPRRP